jgi:hypothetical protein
VLNPSHGRIRIRQKKKLTPEDVSFAILDSPSDSLVANLIPGWTLPLPKGEPALLFHV